jgi:RNA polymerase primary sigma factor
MSKRITPQEEIELAKIIKKGGEESDKAFDRFLQANLRLVLYQVSKMKLTDPDQQQDLIQEGNIGLITAIKKFDPNFGCRFSTYALWWVRQSIHRSMEKDRTIKIPTYRQDLNRKIRTAYEDLGENPKMIPHLCEFFGLSHKDVMLALQPCSCTSLEAEITDGMSVMDTLGVDDDPEEHFLQKEMKEEMYKLLNNLDEPEKILLEMRFGLGGQDPSTYQRIGEVLGISRTQVGHNLSRVLGQLRKQANNR